MSKTVVSSSVFRKTINVLLVFAVLFLMTFTNVSQAKADTPNDRIRAFLALAKGEKTFTDESLNLTQDQLRFMGIFLSNYYVPFGTELGVAVTDEGETDETLAGMSAVLQKVLSFEKNTADILVEQIIGSIRSGSKELQWAFADNPDGDGIKPISWGVEVTYGNLLAIASGYFSPDKKYANNSQTVCENKYGQSVVVKGICSGSYRYVYLGFTGDDGAFKPAMSFDSWGEVATTSTVALISAIGASNPDYGYGTSYWDLNNKTDANQPSNIELTFPDGSGTSGEEALGYTAFATKLKISPYGDIIGVGKARQYIIIPASLNPGIWRSVNADGNDETGKKFMNTVFAPSIFTTTKSLDDLWNNVQNFSNTHKNTASNYGLFAPPVVRGSNKTESYNGFAWGTSDTEALYKRIHETYRTKNVDIARLPTNLKDETSVPVTHFFGYNSIDHNTLQQFARAFPTKESDFNINYQRDNAILIDQLQLHENSTSTFPIGSISTITSPLTAPGLGSAFDNALAKQTNDVPWFASWKDASNEFGLTIYLSYARASFYSHSNAEDLKAGIGALGYRLEKANLPPIPEKLITSDLASRIREDMQLTAIRDWIYYLLHPTEGAPYFTTWTNNKVGGWILNQHDKIIGTEGSGVLAGSSHYTGMSGYVTTPELNDIEWLDNVIKFYKSNIQYVILLVIALMGVYALLRILTPLQAVFGGLLFIFASMLPIPVLNAGISVANSFSDKVYSDKFQFWALLQTEGYINEIDESANAENYQDYLAGMYQARAKTLNSAGGASVVLKWQGVKKMDSLQIGATENDMFDDDLLAMVQPALQNNYSGEFFTENPQDAYLYRSYVDVMNYSRFIYRAMRDTSLDTNPGSMDVKKWPQSLQNAWNNKENTWKNSIDAGYTARGLSGSTILDEQQRIAPALGSSIVSDAFSMRGKVAQMSSSDFVGIDQRYFDFSIPMFTQNKSFMTELKKDGFEPGAGGYDEADYYSLASYALMSENPFYYFSWNFYDQGLNPDIGSAGNYRGLLLGDAYGDYFTNEGLDEDYRNGEMRDYLDMRSLFTYVIPYLREGNALVQEYDSIYGLKVNPGVPTEPGETDPELSGDAEWAQKYWHNQNVARLAKIYTPWVDLMTSANYAKSTTIQTPKGTKTVSDPLNPASYPADRPMIFSRSEMNDYGLKENQLTEVERKILKVQDDTQKGLVDLINYYSFHDSVLNTASASVATFAFNQVFSEKSFANMVGIGESAQIYPQNFELKNFTYDAYLRLMLSNTTGEKFWEPGGTDGKPETNFYAEVAQSNSILTGILMIVNSSLAVYLIPWMKIAFLILAVLSGIAILLASALRIQDKFLQKVMRGILLPVGLFLLVSFLFSLFVSFFMGDGFKDVTGNNASIRLGDPNWLLVIMCLAHIVLALIWGKLLFMLWKTLRGTSKGIFASVSSVIGAGASWIMRRGGKGAGNSTGGGAPVAENKIGYAPEPATQEEETAFQERQKENTEIYNTQLKQTQESRNDDPLEESKKRKEKEDGTKKDGKNSEVGKNVEQVIESGKRKVKEPKRRSFKPSLRNTQKP